MGVMAAAAIAGAATIGGAMISNAGSEETTIERQVADRTKEGDMTWEALMNFVFGAPSTAEDIEGLGVQKSEIQQRLEALQARKDEFMSSSPQIESEIQALANSGDVAFGMPGGGGGYEAAKAIIYKKYGIDASMTDLDNQIAAYQDQLSGLDEQIAQLKESGGKDRQKSYYDTLTESAQKLNTVIDQADEAYKNQVALPREEFFKKADQKYNEILASQKATQAEQQALYNKVKKASTPINVSFGGNPLGTVLPNKNFQRGMLNDMGNASINQANVLGQQTNNQNQYLQGAAADVMVPVDFAKAKSANEIMPMTQTTDLLKSIAIPIEGMRYQGGTTTTNQSGSVSIPEALLGGSIVNDWLKDYLKKNPTVNQPIQQQPAPGTAMAETDLWL